MKKELKENFLLNDPIHTLMLFRAESAELLREIIKTSYFQRLRNVKQLGLTHLVFPGANHSRFSHSLGTAYVANRLIQKINSDSGVVNKDNNSILYGISAGLLHDIGHGPYSHSFEQEYGTFNFDHEIMSIVIMKKIAHEVPSMFQDIIKSIYQMFSSYPAKNNEMKFVHRLISSQLDVDRMDYLLRDSHFCGVDYGNYDIKWLIQSVKYCQDKDVIAFDRKSIGAIEHFLMARRLMTTCVYRHKKVEAITYLLKTFLKELYNYSLDEPISSIKNLPLTKFFKTMSDARESNHEELAESFLRVSDVDVDFIINLIACEQTKRIPSSLHTLANKIYKREIPKVYEIDFSKSKDAEFIVKDLKSSKSLNYDWQIELNLRDFATYKKPKKEEKKDENIYIIDSNDNLTSIDYQSLLVHTFTNKIEVNPIIIFDNIGHPNIGENLEEKLKHSGCLFN